jgi:histidyl-tRNA synthetase
MSNSTQPARGMRDFLPADVRKRNYVISIIKEVYEKYGFEPLETPAVENLETLTGKYGEEGSQLMFKILKRGEKLDVNDKQLADLALRYDLTVPLARVVANYKNELPKFFKRYQIQPVWRADRPARGRYREFYQCDVDAIGSSSMIVEAELISAVCEILERLGFDDFTIRINHRGILTGILEASGILKDKHTDALIALDKLDKIGREGVLMEFQEREIFSTEEGTKMFELLMSLMFKEIEMSVEFPEIQVRGDFNREEIEKLNTDGLLTIRNFINNNKSGEEGLNSVETILDFINGFDTKGKIKLDASLARGLSYYTGAIFEVNVPDFAGSLAGGGRYDGLIGMFGKEAIPACGFSIGLERILVVMEERGMFPPEIENSSADIMVTIWNEETIGESLKLANDLRQKDFRVLVYPEADKLGKQMKYASSIKTKYVAILGDDEVKNGQVTIKNLESGEQKSVERNNLDSINSLF